MGIGWRLLVQIIEYSKKLGKLSSYNMKSTNDSYGAQLKFKHLKQKK